MEKNSTITYQENNSKNLMSLECEEQMTYSWQNINVYINRRRATSGVGIKGIFFSLCHRRKSRTTEKHILKNVSGICRPGELLAILGSSGAGKTTLLNVLNQRNNEKVRVSGEMFLNGQSVNAATLSYKSAYVQQDEMFVGSLTVREQLIFQAMLRMDRHISSSKRMDIVDTVINEMGMTKCSETIIGIPGRIKGISGGETKRLAFACEVLTNPSILFCDEPTSGLDSFMAENVLSIMKNMARKGKTILCTIHQPSSQVYSMFDRILLMAEGRVAFLGDVDDAYKFFGRIGYPCPENYNPADFFISTLAIRPGHEDESRKSVKFICDQFKESIEGLDLIKAVKKSIKTEKRKESFIEEIFHVTYKATWRQQFCALFWRTWLETIREPLIIRTRLLQVLMIGIITGIVYYGQQNDQEGVTNINGTIFLLVFAFSFQSYFIFVNVHCQNLPIFYREHFNGMYRTDVYILSRSFAELPIYFCYPIISTSISYYMVGFNSKPTRFIIYNLIIILVSNTAISFGYWISCLSKNLNMTLVVTLPCMILFEMFAGYYLNWSSIPSYFVWIRYLSWFSYGNEALNINQWSGISNITCDTKLTCFSNGESILEYYQFDRGNLIFDILCLIFLLVIYRFLAFLTLVFKTQRPKIKK